MTSNQKKRKWIIPLLTQSVCIAVYCAKLSKGQQFNLTGSPKIPVLGEEFTWTCEAFVPPGERSADVRFYRNSYSSVLAAVIGSKCYTFGRDPRYIIECLSKSTFTLTIPAENMTEYEQNSIWSCRCSDNELYQSPEVILNIESLGPPHVPLNLWRYFFVLEKTNLSVNCGAAYRNSSIVSWGRFGNNSFHQNGTTLELFHTLRNSSDTYYCIAKNLYSNGDKETVLQFNNVDVLYEPSVSSLSNHTILEGEDLLVTCNVTAGHPRSFVVFWTKADNPNFRFNGTTLIIYRIQRTSSGTYRCTAENYYNYLGKGTSSQTMFVNVFYPPTVYTFDHQRILEGGNLSAACNVVPGNPSSFIVYWTKLDNPLCRQDGAMLGLPNIQRNSSGIYVCTAKNYYNDSYMGVANHSMVVDVL
ncbi:immunoglobulin superfamily member 10-like, partial [Saccostrea cucullata]|uniref:immunoglobulin superfamily member 10-like n=1 Tax=Saccostrea cuccullata TaxID=36930 RepID=UPI002ED42BDE